jgi:hypothetical protein
LELLFALPITDFESHLIHEDTVKGEEREEIEGMHVVGIDAFDPLESLRIDFGKEESV